MSRVENRGRADGPMKRVLVSGAGGFLGAHLVGELAASWTVLGAGRSAAGPAALARWVRIRDEGGGLADAVAADPPDLVIHAAIYDHAADFAVCEVPIRLSATTSYSIFKNPLERLGCELIVLSFEAVQIVVFNLVLSAG